MFYSPAVRRWALFSSIAFAFTCDAIGGVQLVNGSTNLSAYVSTGVGMAVVPPASTLRWYAAPEDVCAYGTNGVEIATWTFVAGHDYTVNVGHNGAVLVDHSNGHTYWFFLGFSTTFVAGFMGIGARWVRKILGGDLERE